MAAPNFFNISRYSFDPPALPGLHATTQSPDWVLLDTKAYIADRRNGTTAIALASNGEAVEVTFWIADPPAVSHFSVHCKELSRIAEEPRVICSDEKVAIICIHWISSKFASARCKVLRDYFVYTARSPENAPSLMRLPSPSPRVLNPREMGLLPTVDAQGFVIAVVRPQLIVPDRYDLHLFVSKNWRWTTRSAQLQPQSVARGNIDRHKMDKVIPLMEEGSLGWVDLLHGILLCNVLDDNPNPVLRFIPLPKPANRDIKHSPWLYRDVAYINGLVKFVEMETWVSSTLTSERTCGSSDDIPRMIFDSDLELDDDDDMCVVDETFSWKAVAWVRKTSDKAWTRDCDVSVDDIAINNNIGHLPPLKKLITYAPTLSMHGDDVVVYLMSKLSMNDDDAWVVAVNITRKTLEDVAMCSAKRFFLFNITYRPCSFSKHLDMTADNHKAGIQINGDDSKYDAEETTILVARLDPCITEDQLKHIFTQSGELGHVQMLVHQQSALIKFIHRCSAENAICEFNGCLIGKNHIRVSWKYNISNGLS